jgi:hypothetical protein
MERTHVLYMRLFHKTFPALPLISIQTVLLCASLAAAADRDLPERLTLNELESVKISRERVSLPVETHLLVPHGTDGETVEPRSGTKFRAACYAYLKENGMLVRRFAVHAPDREGLPLARTTARFMSLLWAVIERRFGTLSVRLRARPVDVWLTRTGQPGGEQIGYSIYIYDVQAERIPIEWARELAHEYGHYVLPGSSGYSDPEDWSNGLLGERLFLRWLRDDIVDRVVEQKQVPFVKLADLTDYCEKQPEPLIDRMRSRGPDLALLKRRDAAGMDEFSALLLFSDATYGSRSLLDMLDYLPFRAASGTKPETFLSALTSLIYSSARFETNVPVNNPMRLLLPKGRYRLTSNGKLSGITLDRGSVSPAGTDTWTINVAVAGWRKFTAAGSQAVRLRWEKL